jgi:RimJ/RimL family protein N-acetyltransferase
MLPELVDRIVIPDSRRLGQRWFELYCPDDSVWTTGIEAALSEHHPEKHYELLLVLDPDRLRTSERALPPGPGVRVEKIEVPIMSQQARDSSLIEEEFLTRTTFGFACLVNDSTVSLCRSNGFAAGGEFMVDVETPDPEHRGRGYARAASQALVEHAISCGYSPLWETVEDNLPSLRLSHGLGFVEQERYPVYAIEF